MKKYILWFRWLAPMFMMWQLPRLIDGILTSFKNLSSPRFWSQSNSFSGKASYDCTVIVISRAMKINRCKITDTPKEQQEWSDHSILVPWKIILFDSLKVYSIQILIKVNKFQQWEKRDSFQRKKLFPFSIVKQTIVKM